MLIEKKVIVAWVTEGGTRTEDTACKATAFRDGRFSIGRDKYQSRPGSTCPIEVQMISTASGTGIVYIQ